MSNETQYLADDYTLLPFFEDSDNDWYDDDDKEFAASVIAKMYDTMNLNWDHCLDERKNHESRRRLYPTPCL